IVIASVWDSLAIDTSVSKASDLASLDHAQPAHGQHGPDIEQAVADDSLLQNIQAFHGTDDQSVLSAAALDLDGQDAVHDVNEWAIAGLVANPSGLHPESSHHDNAAVSSAHDVFRAAIDLDSKLADFRPQQGDGYAIAASEQVERTVTHNPVSSSAPSNSTPDNPVSSSAPSNPTPDHSAPHVSTAPTTTIAHSDTTTAPDLSSASHAQDTIPPLILNVTGLSDIQAPVSDPTAHSDTTIAPDSLSSASPVADTLPASILDATSLSDSNQ